MSEMLEGFGDRLAHRAQRAAEEGEFAARVTVNGDEGLLVLSEDAVVIFLEEADIRVPAELAGSGGVSFAFTAGNSLTIRRGHEGTVVARFVDRDERQALRDRLDAKAWATVTGYGDPFSSAGGNPRWTPPTNRQPPTVRDSSRLAIALLLGGGLVLLIIGVVVANNGATDAVTDGSTGGFYIGTLLGWIGGLLMLVGAIGWGVMLGNQATKRDGSGT